MTVQLHPAVTYEDFVVGLSPDAKEGSLRFDVRPGWLLDAARQAAAVCGRNARRVPPASERNRGPRPAPPRPT